MIHFPNKRTNERLKTLFLTIELSSGGQQVPQRSVLRGVQAAHLTTPPTPPSPLQGHPQSVTGDSQEI